LIVRFVDIGEIVDNHYLNFGLTHGGFIHVYRFHNRFLFGLFHLY